MSDGVKPVRAHLVIHGRVQGVWFRGSARNEAERLGLTGWVRNCPDGSVEAVIEGPQMNVQRMVVWCHQGPRLAQVTRVDQQWGEHTGEFPGFSVKF